MLVLKFKKIKAGTKHIQALAMTLSSQNLVLLRGEKGYVMCGYLNLKVANKFKDVAAKIVGVSTIEDALKAKVASCTYPALKIGIHKGQPIKDVLKIIA
jgi:uncharacterized protein YunC (DUF1805 family)